MSASLPTVVVFLSFVFFVVFVAWVIRTKGKL